MLGDVQGKSGFPHRGASGDDNEVGRLKPGGQLIESLESRRNAGDELALLVEPFDRLKAGFNQVFYRVKRRADPVFGDFEDGALGLVDEFIHIAGVGVTLADDFRGPIDQLSEDPLFFDDFGVIGNIGRGRNAVDEGIQVFNPPDILQIPAGLERLRRG